MVRKIERTVESAPDLDNVKREVKQFQVLKNEIDLLSERQDEIKKRLKSAVETLGEEDDKGHVWLDLGESIEGVSRLQNQRRVSQKLDETKAEKLLASKGILEDCQTTVVVLDQDKIYAAYYEGTITEAEIDMILPSKISYAFCPKE